MEKTFENSTSGELKTALVQLPLKTAYGKKADDPLPERLRALMNALRGSTLVR